MKKMLLLVALGMFCASLAVAQDTPTGQAATPSTSTSAGATTIQGCLSGGDGNYMLTEDGTGASYKLVGDETQLRKHMGHEVAVTGQSTNDSGSQASAAEQEQPQPSANSSWGTTIQVANVKMIAKQCRGAADTSPQH